MACEDAVMATNDDAAQCKRFAVEKGYWQDPYITLLVPKGRAGHAPEINKGYYARVTSIRVLIQKFLQVILPLRCLLEILCAWKRCFRSCLLVFKERKKKRPPPPPPPPPTQFNFMLWPLYKSDFFFVSLPWWECIVSRFKFTRTFQELPYKYNSFVFKHQRIVSIISSITDWHLGLDTPFGFPARPSMNSRTRSQDSANQALMQKQAENETTDPQYSWLRLMNGIISFRYVT